MFEIKLYIACHLVIFFIMNYHEDFNKAQLEVCASQGCIRLTNQDQVPQLIHVQTATLYFIKIHSVILEIQQTQCCPCECSLNFVQRMHKILQV
jgi:hypothetical protein